LEVICAARQGKVDEEDGEDKTNRLVCVEEQAHGLANTPAEKDKEGHETERDLNT
jgi:hypothetical protein